MGFFLQATKGLGLAVALALATGACERAGAPTGAAALQQGEAIYRAECAGCHGLKLESQADWRTRRPDGKLPAPPHDATGHTWHHPMAQLVAITKWGMVPPNAPPGYRSDMPAFAGKLSDRQIEHVLAYIEQQWPAEIRKQRAERLRQQ